MFIKVISIYVTIKSTVYSKSDTLLGFSVFLVVFAIVEKQKIYKRSKMH